MGAFFGQVWAVTKSGNKRHYCRSCGDTICSKSSCSTKDADMSEELDLPPYYCGRLNALGEWIQDLDHGNAPHNEWICTNCVEQVIERRRSQLTTTNPLIEGSE